MGRESIYRLFSGRASASSSSSVHLTVSSHKTNEKLESTIDTEIENQNVSNSDSGRTNIKDYKDNCTLKKLAENHYTPWFMWFVCVAIGAIATTVIIVSLWEKFQTNPTITGLDTDFHNWEVHFPAITVCNYDPSNPDAIAEYANRNSNNDEAKATEIMEYLKKLTQLSFNTIEDFKSNLNKSIIDKDVELKNFIFDMMIPCENLFANKNCRWKVDNISCCDTFKPVFTEIGFCFTFNARHYDNIPEFNDQEPFVVKLIKETDIKWSMQISLIPTADDNEVSVYIHNSDELPGLDIKPQLLWSAQFGAPQSNVDRISFSVKQTYTTNDARQLSIKQRHCVFEDEIKLKTDHMYTFTACTRQCRMDKSMKMCGCVPHFYPVIGGYPQCGLDQLSCIYQHRIIITNLDKCHCHLGCSNTVYEVEKINEITNNSESILEAEFVSWPMVRYKREVLFGWVDLLVSFGGIAGLFLGFSLLSAVEIVYYFTIRTCCMVHQEPDELQKIYDNNRGKGNTNYDMNLVPEFWTATKTKNQGTKVAPMKLNKDEFMIDGINFNPKQIQLQKKVTTVLPPFGIEFIN